jgi:hypothetical protein
MDRQSFDRKQCINEYLGIIQNTDNQLSVFRSTQFYHHPLATDHLLGARDIDSQRTQRRANIQLHLHCITLNRLFIILQIYPISNTRVSHNIQRDNRILVLGLDQTIHNQRLDMRLHGDRVVARLQDQIGEQGVANGGAVDGEVHGDVAEIEGHDGGVRNVDCADHVGTVGEEFGGTGEEFDGGDVQALQFVQTWIVVLVSSSVDGMVKGDLPFIETTLL